MENGKICSRRKPDDTSTEKLYNNQDGHVGPFNNAYNRLLKVLTNCINQFRFVNKKAF